MAEEKGDIEVIEEVRVSRRRIGVIRKLKKQIEELGGVKVEIEKELVKIRGDAISAFVAKRVIKALARGFDASDAFKLFDDEYMLYVIPIAKEKKHLVRIKARIIGTKGKMKREIERLTGAKLAIYGKTVSIIGRPDEAELARIAVEKLIHGASHGKVLSFLARVSKES